MEVHKEFHFFRSNDILGIGDSDSDVSGHIKGSGSVASIPSGVINALNGVACNSRDINRVSAGNIGGHRRSDSVASLVNEVDGDVIGGSDAAIGRIGLGGSAVLSGDNNVEVGIQLADGVEIDGSNAGDTSLVHLNSDGIAELGSKVPNGLCAGLDGEAADKLAQVLSRAKGEGLSGLGGTIVQVGVIAGGNQDEAVSKELGGIAGSLGHDSDLAGQAAADGVVQVHGDGVVCEGTGHAVDSDLVAISGCDVEPCILTGQTGLGPDGVGDLGGFGLIVGQFTDIRLTGAQHHGGRNCSARHIEGDDALPDSLGIVGVVDVAACAVAEHIGVIVLEGDDIDSLVAVIAHQDIVVAAVEFLIGELSVEVVDEVGLDLDVGLLNAGSQDGCQTALREGSVLVAVGGGVVEGVVLGISGQLILFVCAVHTSIVPEHAVQLNIVVVGGITLGADVTDSEAVSAANLLGRQLVDGIDALFAGGIEVVDTGLSELVAGVVVGLDFGGGEVDADGLLGAVAADDLHLVDLDTGADYGGVIEEDSLSKLGVGLSKLHHHHIGGIVGVAAVIGAGTAGADAVMTGTDGIDILDLLHLLGGEGGQVAVAHILLDLDVTVAVDPDEVVDGAAQCADLDSTLIEAIGELVGSAGGPSGGVGHSCALEDGVIVGFLLVVDALLGEGDHSVAAALVHGGEVHRREVAFLIQSGHGGLEDRTLGVQGEVIHAAQLTHGFPAVIEVVVLNEQAAVADDVRVDQTAILVRLDSILITLAGAVVVAVSQESEALSRALDEHQHVAAAAQIHVIAHAAGHTAHIAGVVGVKDMLMDAGLLIDSTVSGSGSEVIAVDLVDLGSDRLGLVGLGLAVDDSVVDYVVHS